MTRYDPNNIILLFSYDHIEDSIIARSWYYYIVLYSMRDSAKKDKKKNTHNTLIYLSIYNYNPKPAIQDSSQPASQTHGQSLGF